MGGKVKGKANLNRNLGNNGSSTESSRKKKIDTKKKKKDTVKNTLANPFSLDWPSLNYKDYTDIKSLLKNSLSVISKDYVSYLNEKNIKRREFYAAKLKMKESDKNCTPKNNKISNSTMKNSAIERISSNGVIIGHESLIFGYNAVMRGLEKGYVISLLVNSKAKPDLIVKMFIPICSVKLIPVIPIDDLSYIVKDAGIGIKSCLALGLKKSVTLEENIFHPLYLKTCEALGFDVSPSNILEVSNLLTKETYETSPKLTEVEDNKTVRISAEQIKSFHLYRSNDQERMFKPNQLKDNDAPSSSNILICDADFIRFDDVSDVKISKKGSKKWQKSKLVISKLDASKLPSTSMFTIDSTGDSHDRNDIKDCKSEISDVVKPFVNTNNLFDGSDDTKVSLFADSSTFAEYNKSLENKLTDSTETHSSSSLECAVVDSTENLNSSLIVSSKSNKRQQFAPNLEDSDLTQVANSSLIRPLMNNKKKRKFEEFCYVPTKVKRIKSSGKQKRAKK